jgi:hypothetical protein
MPKIRIGFKNQSLRKKQQLPISQDGKKIFITYYLDKWKGLVERVRENGCAYRVLVGRPEVKDHLESSGVDESLVLTF